MVTKRLGYELIIFHPVISDPVDFKGMPWLFTDDDGNERCVFVPFDQLEALISASKPTVCFLDDFIQAPPAVQAACMQLLHGGNLAGKQISKHVRFVACSNRRGDRAGGSSVLEPIKSRFHGIFELSPEIDPWVSYGIKKGWSPVLIAFMRHRPEWLQGGSEGWKPVADIVNQPSPRTIEHLADIINLKLPKTVKPSAYAGAVGTPMANEYFAFEQLLTRIPDIDVVLSNPAAAEIPDAPDVKYAMLGALHSRMNRKNLGNIYKYIGRAFPLELQAVFTLDVEQYNKSLVQHPAYVKWCADNGDVFTN
jgi:hypothetical protein